MNINRSISFIVPGAPSTMTSQQKGINFRARRVYTKSEVKAEQFRISLFARRYRPSTPFVGPCEASISVVFPLPNDLAEKYVSRLSDPLFMIPCTEKPDVDNSSKLVLDVLAECGFFKNDKQVFREHLEKFWGADPRIAISVRECIWTEPVS